MIQATSAWVYVANTKFLLNKPTPYHALNNWARSRPWLDVGARIAHQWMFQILSEILFCKVIFTNNFLIKKIYIMTSFNESPFQ